MSTGEENRVSLMKEALGLTVEEERLLADVGKKILPEIGFPGADTGRRDLDFLELLFGGRYDSTYQSAREKMIVESAGHPDPTHVILSGYTTYLEKIPSILARHYGDSPERMHKILNAIWKVLLLDVDLSCFHCAGQSVQLVRQQRDDLREIVDDKTNQLRMSEVRYRELIDNYPEMVLVFDRDARLVDRNRKAKELLEGDGDSESPLDLHDLVERGEANRFEAHVRRVIERGHDRIETVLRLPGDKVRYVEMVSTALYDEDGDFLWARSFLRDLTDKKRFEAEMLKWERLVAVGSMAAKVAHEIRNPLSSISLNVELLQDEIKARKETNQEESLSLVNSILSEIDRLSVLIEEYLTFGRLPKPSVEPVPTSEFLHNLAEFVRRDFEDRRCVLEIEVHPRAPAFLADPNHAKQVLLNLLRNAVESMPDGGKVTITAGSREEFLIVDVRDTGVGIEKVNLRSIFDPMYTTKDFGTGLGLPFVQQVMREHGGRVTCSSEEGKGTVFSLYFPVAPG